MSSSPSRIRRQLAAELAHLRSVSGLTARELAGELGIPGHARVVRIEAATSCPDIKLARRWLTATEADEDACARVLVLVRAAHAEAVRWPDALTATGSGHLQGVAADREENATLVCSYEQAYLPGLVQLGSYTAALMAHFDLDQDIDGAVAARIRRQEILHRGGREFRFVVTRRALTWNPGGVDMDAQLSRLRELDRLDGASVRLLADDAEVFSSFSSFNLYLGGPEPVVAVELESAELALSDPESVTVYERRFEELYAAAGPLPTP